MSAPIVLVLAVADNGVIGAKGTIPWHIPEDLRHFKAITMGRPLLVGRRTWDSFSRKPLPGRTNIVITRDQKWTAPGAVVAHSLEEALARAKQEQPREIVIAGGGEIYRAALPLASRIELTEVHLTPNGDVHFPLLDKSIWHETSREERKTPDGLGFSFVRLVR